MNKEPKECKVCKKRKADVAKFQLCRRCYQFARRHKLIEVEQIEKKDPVDVARILEGVAE